MGNQQKLRTAPKHQRPKPSINYQIDRVACPDCGALRPDENEATRCGKCRCALVNQSVMRWLADQDEANGKTDRAVTRRTIANFMRRLDPDV